MKKEWIYAGKSYIIYDDRQGNLYLNCKLCDCADILEGINSEDPNKKLAAYKKAISIVEQMDEKKNHKKVSFSSDTTGSDTENDKEPNYKLIGCPVNRSKFSLPF